MSPSLVHYVPVVTTILTVPFAFEIFGRYRRHPDRLHLLWWAAGVGIYGVGTLTESLTTLIGWREPIFRAWYISGALLGGAPLAQGTVYLLLPRRRAHQLTAALLTVVAIAATAVLLSPIDYTQVEGHRLTGRVLAWPWVRRFSPFINLYAVVFLIGGAILSAVRYSGNPATRHRVGANVLIAVGAILPGIGGTATRMGYTEVLYVTELAGLLLIWAGYRISQRAIISPSIRVPSSSRARAIFLRPVAALTGWRRAPATNLAMRISSFGAFTSPLEFDARATTRRRRRGGCRDGRDTRALRARFCRAGYEGQPDPPGPGSRQQSRRDPRCQAPALNEVGPRPPGSA